MSIHSEQPRRVAVLGAAGNIGKAACAGCLGRGHSVRGIDIVDRPPPGVEDFVVADICDREAVRKALRDIEVVIHLTLGGLDGDPRDTMVGPSFLGVWNICEAAADCGIDRLILTSTNQVVENPEAQDRLIRTDVAYTPASVYGLSKVFLEGLGRLYAGTHAMSVLIIRPGWMPGSLDDMETIGTTLRTRNMYLSFNDAANFFACAVETDRLPAPGVEVVYVQSRGEKPDGGLDREPALRLLGYEGRDIWPDGYPGLSEKVESRG